MIQGAGLGLFAAWDLEFDEMIGVYLGTKRNNLSYSRKHVHRTKYVMAIDLDEGLRYIIRFVCPAGMKLDGSEPLLYFGIHYANDPGMSSEESTRPTTQASFQFYL
jgi:hypothetical protein